MKKESLAFALSGTFFGLLMGWIIGSQQAAPVAVDTPPPAAAQASANNAPEPPPFDAARVAQMEQQANGEPSNATLRTSIGNAYFDAEQYGKAITWYEAAIALDPKNADLSTDLGVAYYYSNQVDRALAQLETSLKIDPRHLKSLLNQGIVLAFGKQDLKGAAASWQRVVDLSPTSVEGQRAQQGLDGLRAAHAQAGANPAAQP